MIRELTVLTTACTDPWQNLALEAYLLDRVQPGTCMLYLWQNKNTVVFGRNQNAACECRLSLLLQDGGRAARRLSGGGAVYHDLGNLNFTFLLPSEDFDMDRQFQVLTGALEKFDIRAERSGRNDLTADEKKFSGHAFYHTGEKSCHHGTLMVSVDQNTMSRYLNVPPIKLKAKGVSSVRSRVVNLSDLNPQVRVPALQRALVESFEETYGASARIMQEEEIDPALLSSYILKFSSPEWIYGKNRPAQYSRQARFAWGTAQLDFSITDGCLSDPVLWTDSLETDFPERIGSLLSGVTACPEEVEKALIRGGEKRDLASDIASMFGES